MYDIPKLKRKKAALGYTTLRLAKKAKRPESTVRGILATGSGHPDNVRAVAKALGFELEELLIEDEEKSA